MAFQFRADLRMVLEKLAWIEWRIELLTGDKTLQSMIVIAKANLQAFHNGFHASEQSMLVEAREFGNVMLKGPAFSLFPSSESAFETFGCLNSKPVGDTCEAVLYFGLEHNSDYPRARWAAKEFFWLVRDMRQVFQCGQKYKIEGSDGDYHISELRNVVGRMQLFERQLHASR